MLSNAYFLAKFRFDTDENEPAKNLQNFENFAFTPGSRRREAPRRESGRRRRLHRARSPCRSRGTRWTIEMLHFLKQIFQQLFENSAGGGGAFPWAAGRPLPCFLPFSLFPSRPSNLGLFGVLLQTPEPEKNLRN